MKRPSILSDIDQLLFKMKRKPSQIALHSSDYDDYQNYVAHLIKSRSLNSLITKSHYVGIPVIQNGVCS